MMPIMGVAIILTFMRRKSKQAQISTTTPLTEASVLRVE
jgi:hypothetical protein